MFLCTPCHSLGGCKNDFELPSRGTCEHCGTSASCVDCHGYNFSDKTEEEIDQIVQDLERGARYSFWLQGEDGGPWRQVTEGEFRNAEMRAGFMRPTGGFSMSSGSQYVAGSMACDDVLEEMDDKGLARLYGYRGEQWLDAWRNRDHDKVSTRG